MKPYNLKNYTSSNVSSEPKQRKLKVQNNNHTFVGLEIDKRISDSLTIKKLQKIPLIKTHKSYKDKSKSIKRSKMSHKELKESLKQEEQYLQSSINTFLSSNNNDSKMHSYSIYDLNKQNSFFTSNLKLFSSHRDSFDSPYINTDRLVNDIKSISKSFLTYKTMNRTKTANALNFDMDKSSIFKLNEIKRKKTSKSKGTNTSPTIDKLLNKIKKKSTNISKDILIKSKTKIPKQKAKIPKIALNYKQNSHNQSENKTLMDRNNSKNTKPAKMLFSKIHNKTIADKLNISYESTSSEKDSLFKIPAFKLNNKDSASDVIQINLLNSLLDSNPFEDKTLNNQLLTVQKSIKKAKKNIHVTNGDNLNTSSLKEYKMHSNFNSSRSIKAPRNNNLNISPQKSTKMDNTVSKFSVLNNYRRPSREENILKYNYNNMEDMLKETVNRTNQTKENFLLSNKTNLIINKTNLSPETKKEIMQRKNKRAVSTKDFTKYLYSKQNNDSNSMNNDKEKYSNNIKLLSKFKIKNNNIENPNTSKSVNKVTKFKVVSPEKKVMFPTTNLKSNLSHIDDNNESWDNRLYGNFLELNRKSLNIDAYKSMNKLNSFNRFTNAKRKKHLNINNNNNNNIPTKTDNLRRLSQFNFSQADLINFLRENTKNSSLQKLSNKSLKEVDPLQKIILQKISSSLKQSNIFKNTIKETLKIQPIRRLEKIKKVYDSLSDDEVLEDYEVLSKGFGFPSRGIFRLSFDLIVFIVSILALVICYFYYSYITVSHVNKFNLTFCFTVNIIFDIFNILDFLFGFCWSFYDESENEINLLSRTSLHYSSSFVMIIDFICAIPLNSIYSGVLCISWLNTSNNFKLSNYNNYTYNNFFINKVGIEIAFAMLFIRGIKVFKYFFSNSSNYISNRSYFSCNNNTVYHTLYELSNYLDFSTFKRRVLKYCLFFFIANHLLTCLWIWIGSIEFPNWLYNTNILDSNPYTIYVASYYFNITTLFTVGYGDIIGVNYTEKAYCVFLMLVSMIIYTFIISNVSNIIESVEDQTQQSQELLDFLENARIKYNIDGKLYNKVRRFLDNKSIKQNTNKSLLLNDLPSSIKNDVTCIVYDEFLRKMKFFKPVRFYLSSKKGISFDSGEELFITQPEFAMRVLHSLTPIKYYKNEFIYKQDDMVDELIFIETGILSVEMTYNEMVFKLILLHQGEFFGDVQMILNQKAMFDLRVKSKCADMYLLPKFDFIQITKDFQDVFKSIYKESSYNLLVLQIIKENCIKEIEIVKSINVSLNVSSSSNVKDNDKDSVSKSQNGLNTSKFSKSPILNGSKKKLFKRTITISEKNDAISALNRRIKKKKEDNEVSYVDLEEIPSLEVNKLDSKNFNYSSNSNNDTLKNFKMGNYNNYNSDSSCITPNNKIKKITYNINNLSYNKNSDSNSHVDNIDKSSIDSNISLNIISENDEEYNHDNDDDIVLKKKKLFSIMTIRSLIKKKSIKSGGDDLKNTFSELSQNSNKNKLVKERSQQKNKVSSNESLKMQPYNLKLLQFNNKNKSNSIITQPISNLNLLDNLKNEVKFSSKTNILVNNSNEINKNNVKEKTINRQLTDNLLDLKLKTPKKRLKKNISILPFNKSDTNSNLNFLHQQLFDDGEVNKKNTVTNSQISKGSSFKKIQTKKTFDTSNLNRNLSPFLSRKLNLNLKTMSTNKSFNLRNNNRKSCHYSPNVFNLDTLTYTNKSNRLSFNLNNVKSMSNLKNYKELNDFSNNFVRNLNNRQSCVYTPDKEANFSLTRSDNFNAFFKSINNNDHSDNTDNTYKNNIQTQNKSVCNMNKNKSDKNNSLKQTAFFNMKTKKYQSSQTLSSLSADNNIRILNSNNKESKDDDNKIHPSNYNTSSNFKIFDKEQTNSNISNVPGNNDIRKNTIESVFYNNSKIKSFKARNSLSKRKSKGKQRKATDILQRGEFNINFNINLNISPYPSISDFEGNKNQIFNKNKNSMNYFDNEKHNNIEDENNNANNASSNNKKRMQFNSDLNLPNKPETPYRNYQNKENKSSLTAKPTPLMKKRDLNINELSNNNSRNFLMNYNNSKVNNNNNSNINQNNQNSSIESINLKNNKSNVSQLFSSIHNQTNNNKTNNTNINNSTKINKLESKNMNYKLSQLNSNAMKRSSIIKFKQGINFNQVKKSRDLLMTEIEDIVAINSHNIENPKSYFVDNFTKWLKDYKEKK